MDHAQQVQAEYDRLLAAYEQRNPLVAGRVAPATQAQLAQQAENIVTNEEYRQARIARDLAAEQARTEARESERMAQVQAAIDEYQARARASWPGDAKSFDAAWPDLLRRWQLDQVAQAEHDRLTILRGHAAYGI